VCFSVSTRSFRFFLLSIEVIPNLSNELSKRAIILFNGSHVNLNGQNLFVQLIDKPLHYGTRYDSQHCSLQPCSSGVMGTFEGTCKLFLEGPDPIKFRQQKMVSEDFQKPFASIFPKSIELSFNNRVFCVFKAHWVRLLEGPTAAVIRGPGICKSTQGQVSQSSTEPLHLLDQSNGLDLSLFG